MRPDDSARCACFRQANAQLLEVERQSRLCGAQRRSAEKHCGNAEGGETKGIGGA
jgi:hypothetical protein